LLYQTLLGTWPVNARGEAEKTANPEYIQRVQSYMSKALNEAKINTSWVQPNEEWLAAMRDFIAKTLESSSKNKFLPSFLPVVEEIGRLGAINSLTQTLLKFASPGVPDIYQGNDIWDFSLVDPDNRRPVDYHQRRAMLDTLAKARPEELLQNWPDGRIKMFLTQRMLRFRREQVDLFRQGSYLPLSAAGELQNCCVSFAREFGGKWIVVIAARLSSRIGFPPIGEKWRDAVVELPEKLLLGNVREIFTGREIHLDGPRLGVAEAMPVLPFAVVASASCR
jgi:(1->4)-alpha-D-glucan 1-alpha-D-glucosylmutase